MVCSKNHSPSCSPEQRPSKGIEKLIFGLLEGHITIENLQSQFFSKSEHFLKRMN